MTTPWTDALIQRGARLDAGSVRFPQSSTPASAQVVPLLHLGVIAARGEESAGFLHNLFSNDVTKLPAGQAQWNSFNSPKGRMLASFLLWGEDDGHRLVLSADITAAIHKKLSMYVLRSKVKLTDASADTALIGVCGEASAEVLARAGLTAGDTMTLGGDAACRVITLAAGQWLLALPADKAAELFDRLVAAGAVPAGTEAWQLGMIRVGVPLITTALQEEFVAQMLNYDLIGGVSFKKGCYPGQEIVARTQYLGKLKKRMYRVALPEGSTATPGQDLYAPEFGDQSAGKLVNIAENGEGGREALAVLQSSAAEAGEIHLGSPQGPTLRLLELPYALP